MYKTSFSQDSDMAKTILELQFEDEKIGNEIATGYREEKVSKPCPEALWVQSGLS
jgi:hypothetical protein